jgi:hypothetical protein
MSESETFSHKKTKYQATDEAKKAKDFVTLQKAHNKMLRTLCKLRIKDKISIESMLSNQNMLSVNQLNAQIKLTEMWKAANI